MADGSPPNKRQKTVGTADTLYDDLENALPDDLLGSGSSNSGLTNGPSSGVNSSQISSVQTGQQQGLPAPPPTSMSHPMSTLQGNKHIKQLLKSGHNSPKYVGTPSPSMNNSNNSPRTSVNQPQPSPINSIQSPGMAQIHGMKSPQMNMPVPGSLPRPGSALNSSATPSPRPGSSHLVNSSMSSVVQNNGTNMIPNPISSPMNNMMQPQQIATVSSQQQSMQMASQNSMMLNSMQQQQPQQHQMMNGMSNPMSAIPQTNVGNGPMNQMPRQNIMNINQVNNSGGVNYMPQMQPNINIQSGNNSFNNQMRMPQPTAKLGQMSSMNNFVQNQSAGMQSSIAQQSNSILNNNTFMTRTPNNMQGMMTQAGNNPMMSSGNPGTMNQNMMQQQPSLDQTNMSQFNQQQMMPQGGMQTNNTLQQGGQPIRMMNQGPANPGSMNMQPGQPTTMPGMQQIGQSNPMQNVPQGSNPPNILGASGGNSSASSDPEKRRLIQQQLVLLLHAYKCSKKEEKGEISNCTLPHCRTMKDVLRHMNNCSQGKSCQTAHCASSRQIIAHWTACKRNDCVVCLPLKNVHNNNSTTGSNPVTQGGTGQPNHPISNDYPASQSGGPSLNTDSFLTPAGQSKPLNGMVSGLEGQQPPQILQIGSVGQNQGQDFGGMFQIAPPKTPREWHREVTDELRTHLVRKLVQAIFPQPQRFSITDDRMKKLIQFARKVEGDMYEQANNRGEYYHLLAEKIYKIQKELEEKRTSRTKTKTTCGTSQAGQVPNGPMVSHPGGPGIQYFQNNSQGIRMPVNNAAGMANNQINRNLQPATSGMVLKLHEAKAFMDKNNQLNQQNQGFMATTSNATNSSMGMNSTMNAYSLSNDMQTPNSQRMVNAQPKQTTTQLESLLQRKTPPQIQNSDAGSLNINTALSMVGATVPTGNINSSINSFNLQQQNTNSPMNFQSGRSMPLVQSQNINSMTSTMTATTTMASSMPSTSLTSSTPMSMSTVANASSPSRPFVSGPSVLSASSNANLHQKPDGSNTNMNVFNQVKSEPQETKPFVKNENSSWSPGSALSTHTTIKSEPVDQDSNVTSTSGQPFVKQEVKSEPGIVLKTDPPTPSRPIVPRAKKEFTMEELRDAFIGVVEKLYQQNPESMPFREPVDPEKLNIPDYFEIVKKPMDLTTIKMKLESGRYEEPWEFISDIWLMFNNAWLYNRRTSRVYKFCSRLKEIFEQEIDPVMQSLGYCCGRKLEFMPMTLCCYGKQLCTIPTGATYYEYQNRYDYCEKCFNDIQGDNVPLGDEPNQSQSAIPKSSFTKKKNNVLDPEPFVHCSECGRKLHKICVLHNSQIWPEFTCDKCHAVRGTQRKPNKYMASKLPQTKLSDHIERRVNNYLKEHDRNGEAGHVHIRVVYIGDKTVEVRSGMKARFVDTKEMPKSFPYRAKAFFAFEEIDGVDVCFFGVHVQEYGSESPQPNQRRVYLSYLDSVHFFRPRHLRTAVYHEILIGYFEFCKNLGYEFAHIWACPPCEGDDYIFHCHPVEQKIPKPKRLQDWYKKMLDIAIVNQIVVDYRDIFHQAKEDRLQSARELPYFEGDFWPNVLEESIKELEQEEEDRKQAEATEQAAAEDGNTANSKNGKKTRPKKGNSKKASQRSAKKKLPAVANDLSDKLYQIMEKHKEVFFVMRLNTAETISKMGPTRDPDSPMHCELMDGRDAFLTMAREKHYEFSSLRRTKWSTMAMLVELHTQGQDRFVYTCNKCKNSVEAVDTRFHCTVCEDFDLCSKCYNSVGHNHKMEQMDFGLDNSASPGASSNNSKSNMPVQRCMQSLVHACQCRNANCNMVACKKMKRIVAHARTCKRKTTGACQICRQLIALCCYHAKHCQETKCSVAFCYSIKDKLRRQEQQQRVQQAQLMKRRMALMSRNLSQTATPSTPAAPSTPLQDAQTPKSQLVEKAQPSPMQPLNPQMQSQPYQNDFSNQGQVPMRNGQPPMPNSMILQPQQSISMNSPQTSLQPMVSPQQNAHNTTLYQPNPPQGAVRAAKEAEELAKKQAQNSFGGMRNPTPMQNHPQQPPQRPGMQIPNWNNPNQRPVQNMQSYRQPGPMGHVLHPQQPSNQVGNATSGTSHDLQKVISILKRNPMSNDQGQPGSATGPSLNKIPKSETQEVLTILKRNPQLMATIIRNKKMGNREPLNNQQQILQPSGQVQTMGLRQPMNDMVNTMNQQPQQNMQPMMQHNPMQGNMGGNMQQMQWQNHQIQQQPQQQATFSQPAPPYRQAVQQQRMQQQIRMHQQQRFPMRPTMGQNMGQNMMGMNMPQQHPGMMGGGVPQVNTQVGGQPVVNSRPASQPGISPHHVGAGRTTPLGQNQMGQVGMGHMGGSMEQQFNPNTQGGMMGGGFNRPMGNMNTVGQMNPHMGFNTGVQEGVPTNTMSNPDLDKFVGNE